MLQQELKTVSEKSKAIEELQTQAINNVLQVKIKLDENTTLLKPFEVLFNKLK